jgi:gamma-glutamyltranspeptidase / glutathione hydrolase
MLRELTGALDQMVESGTIVGTCARERRHVARYANHVYVIDRQLTKTPDGVAEMAHLGTRWAWLRESLGRKREAALARSAKVWFALEDRAIVRCRTPYTNRMTPVRRLTLVLLSASLCILARQPDYARHGMVVSGEPLATDVGVRVLRAGGNAVDAAVAVGFALAVTYPYAGNLGGGGFMLIRFADGRSTFIDFRERAPEKASRDMYLDPQGRPSRDSIEGWRASGVPGTVKGFELAQKKYGRATWESLVAPAVELARSGFPVSYSFAESLRASRTLPRDSESRRVFLKKGAYYYAGDTFQQPDLARTLETIGRQGARGFYEGAIAQQLAGAMARNGGLITLDDLRHYRAVERTPLTGTYRDYAIVTAPPPSSGGIGLLQMLGMIEGSGYEKSGAGSAAAIHFVAEAMRRFYADRSRYLGDPDFVKIPVAGLVDSAYLRQRRATINPERATPSAEVLPGAPAGHESSETTHYNVVDTEGNAVSVTYTLNGGYGSGITIPGAGFLMNNEMDDFAAQPGATNMFGLVQGEANAIQPDKRPLSSMTPTILTHGGKLFLVLGGPGGPRIITSVLEVILNVVDFGMNVQDAVDFPRFHHQWQPDRLSLESGFSPDTVALLKARGHVVDQASGSGSVASLVEAILQEQGWLEGAVDGRRPGKAAGY